MTMKIKLAQLMPIQLMQMGFAAATAVVALALAVPLAAQAADLRLKAPIKAPPPPPPAWSWSGFYGGVNGGYGWGDDPVSFSAANAAAAVYFTGAAVPGGVNTKSAGGLFGVQLGYNWQMTPQFVFGFETDFDWADIDGAGSVATTAAGFAPFTTSASQTLSWLGTARGRLGVTFDRALIYATGGLAYGRTSLSTSIVGLVGGACGPAGLCAGASSAGWQTGWTVGGGIEWGITPALSLKAEYLHYDLGSRSLVQFDPTIPGTLFASSANFSGDIVRAGLNYRFGGDGPIVTRY
jgi:outer membrane immunogenic protein